MEYDERVKLDAFQPPTTYLSDYQKFIPDKRKHYDWPKNISEPPSKSQKEFQRLDPETFSKYKKDVHVPFNLFVEPRPITNTHPKDCYSILPTFLDTGKEEAIKTRPRLYLTPAVSMDDVPSAEMRNLLCEFMYTTDWKKASKEAAQGVTTRSIPTSTWEDGRYPVKLSTELDPPIPEGWRKKAKPWDVKQRRAQVDSTAMFWLHKDPPVKCGACVNPYKGVVSQEMKDKIEDLLKRDKLRLAHDYTNPSYAGYQPRLSRGVPLSKTDLPVSHPFLSLSQAVTQRYTLEE